MLILDRHSAIQRARTKPHQWGPLSAVLSAIYNNLKYVGLSCNDIVGYWPMWESGSEVIRSFFNSELCEGTFRGSGIEWTLDQTRFKYRNFGIAAGDINASGDEYSVILTGISPFSFDGDYAKLIAKYDDAYSNQCCLNVSLDTRTAEGHIRTALHNGSWYEWETDEILINKYGNHTIILSYSNITGEVIFNIDGIEVTTTQLAGSGTIPLPTNGASLTFGNRDDYAHTNAYEGFMSSAILIDRALTLEQRDFFAKYPYILLQKPTYINIVNFAITGASYSANVDDTFSVSESVTKTVDFLSASTDIINTSDDIQRIATYVTQIIDAIQTSDNTDSTLAQIIEVLITDGVTLNDLAAATLALHGLIDDSIIFSDTGNSVAQFISSISDNLHTKSSITALGYFISSASDGLSFSDSRIASVLRLIEALMDDGINLNDLNSVIANFETVVEDGGWFSDYSQVTTLYIAQLVSGLNFSDEALSSLGFLLSGAISDGISLNDLTTRIASFQAQTTDGIIHSDESEKLAQFTASLIDAITNSDSTRFVGGIIEALLADAFNVSDQLLGGSLFERALTDGIITSDSSERQRFLHALLTDQTLLNDKYFVGRLTVLLVKLISSGPNIKITGRSN